MWMLLMPSFLSIHNSSMMFSGERRRIVILVADVLDAVGAARRAAAAGDDEGERAFDQRHAVFLQGQQLMHRHRQSSRLAMNGRGN